MKTVHQISSFGMSHGRQNSWMATQGPSCSSDSGPTCRAWWNFLLRGMRKDNDYAPKKSHSKENLFFSDNVLSLTIFLANVQVLKPSKTEKNDSRVHVSKSCRNLFEGFFFGFGNRRPLWWCLISWQPKFCFWGSSIVGRNCGDWDFQNCSFFVTFWQQSLKEIKF